MTCYGKDLRSDSDVTVCVEAESDVPARPGAQEPDDLDDGLDALLDEYDALDRGFKRRERLDVKKPGPYFSTNNYAFHSTETRDEQESKQVSAVTCTRTLGGETEGLVRSTSYNQVGGGGGQTITLLEG